MGVPGSGKSFWAKAEASKNPKIVVVEKDEIRDELASTSGWTWSKEREASDIIPRRDERIRLALKAGCSVISSDTNLDRVHKTSLSALAQEAGVEFEIRRFDVPLEECIRRDRERPKPVGEAVVRKFWTKYVKDDWTHFPVSALKPEIVLRKVQDNPFLPKALICDLDGTLALNDGHRSHYDASKSDEDDVNFPVEELLHAFSKQGYQIIYLTGREEIHREPSQKFLDKWGMPEGPLYMRPKGDTRKDWLVKLEIFDREIRDKFQVVFCLEDRSRVVQMWREIGLTCLQVGEGDF
jgi:predicted kinase